MSDTAKHARTEVGTVVSDKMHKSIVVQVERKILHPKYKKYINRRAKRHVHDEQNQCKVGDVVRIVETRPRSKTKTWDLQEIIQSVGA